MGKPADWYAFRAAAETIVCDECHMPPGETCRNEYTGKPVTHLPAHWKRLEATRHTASQEPPTDLDELTQEP